MVLLRDEDDTLGNSSLEAEEGHRLALSIAGSGSNLIEPVSMPPHHRLYPNIWEEQFSVFRAYCYCLLLRQYNNTKSVFRIQEAKASSTSSLIIIIIKNNIGLRAQGISEVV